MADQQDPYGSNPTGQWGAPEGDQPSPAEPAPPEETAGLEGAAEGAAAAASAATAQAAATLADLRGAPRSVFFGAIAIAIIGVVGVALDVWPMMWTGVILILLGVAAAVLVWLGAAGTNVLPFAGRYVDLFAGLVATAIGAGGIVEAVFDLDQDDLVARLIAYGALAAAGLFVVLATGRAWPGGAGAIAKPVRPGAERGGRLAFLGILLVILGWLVNVTVGVWTWYPASLVVFLILVVAVVLLMISDDAFGPRIPVPAAWIAAGVAIWAALITFIEHVQSFVNQDRFEPGLEDWLGVALYAAGIVLVVIGTVLMAINARPAPSEPSTPTSA
jgi:hypothetical protein